MTLPRFVHRFFDLIGARTEATNDGLRVELTREQLQLLEGRPRWGWSAGGDDLTVLYFTFTAERHSEQTEQTTNGVQQRNRMQPGDRVQPELIEPGSFRWRQLIDATVRLWPLGRVFVRPANTSVKLWRPHLVFHFTVTYVARAATRQRATSVTVDLLTGTARPFARFDPDAELLSDAGDSPAQTPRLSVGDAHERAADFVCNVLAEEDGQWATDERRHIEHEFEQLQSYIRRAELEESPEPLVAVREARLTELRHMLPPRVQVRADAATILYTPGDDSVGV